MMSRTSVVLLAVFGLADAFQSLITNTRIGFTKLAAGPNDRRDFIVNSAATLASALLWQSCVQQASAADDEPVEVYFGCGCFWHVQHEFVEAERNILGRSDDELTARAGYAGGKAGAVNGKVCYHNAQNIADYGKLGHAEVVMLKIPPSKFPEFAVEYCKLFKNGMRPDQLGDRGSEYRNLIGFVGGSKSPFAQQLVDASKATADQLDFAVGKGSDEDIARLVWIMDIEKYPFFVGEAYHQFHDGFAMGENYPDSYNTLAQKFVKKGENFGSCPNGMMGLGVGGL
ncbi:Peptide methionine sulfoxide reductase [Fragilaria crotonensis]|nr:Peptide methionine sulfoxide reductase [Fragilaria crotonensis]